MRKQDVSKGTRVTTPDGTVAKVSGFRKTETGKKGRPATLFTVNGSEYRAKDLRPAA